MRFWAHDVFFVPVEHHASVHGSIQVASTKVDDSREEEKEEKKDEEWEEVMEAEAERGSEVGNECIIMNPATDRWFNDKIELNTLYNKAIFW